MINDLHKKIFKQQIHLRKQDRNGRKCVTIIEGLNGETLNLKKLSQNLAKNNQCSCTVINCDTKKVIQMTGDKRESVKKFLIDEEIAEELEINVHG